MSIKHVVPELALIFKAVQQHASNTAGPGTPVTVLEGVVEECWGIMNPAQRDQLLASKVVSDLRGISQVEPAVIVALPHNHRVVTYYVAGSAAETMFQSLLAVWYQVADILRQKPAGTVATYKGGSLVMGEMNGELFMFDSPDVGNNSHDWNMFRPDDFNGIDADDLQQIRDSLQLWLENPVYDAPINPELVSAAITHHYSNTSSRPHWSWDASTSI